MNQWSPASVSVRALEWMDSDSQSAQTDLPKRSNRSLHNVAHCRWWWSMVDGRCWLGALIDLSHNRWSFPSPSPFGMECGSHILSLGLSLASGLIKRHSFWIKIKWIKLKACNALSHGGCHIATLPQLPHCHVASCQLKSCNKIVFNLIAPSGQPRAF